MLLRDIAIGIHWATEKKIQAELLFREEAKKWDTAIAKYREECPHPKWINYTGYDSTSNFSDCELCGLRQ